MAYAVQIANPQVVQKIETLATVLKLGKTAVIDYALDVLNAQLSADKTALKPMPCAINSDIGLSDEQREFLAIVQRLQQIPEILGAPKDLEWDAFGLPV